MIQPYNFWVYIQKNLSALCRDTCTVLFIVSLFIHKNQNVKLLLSIENVE